MYSNYSITQPSLKFLADLTLKNTVRAALTNIALGRVLASRLPVPSMKVESAALYFISDCSTTVRGVLGAINEAAPIDCGAVEDMVNKFWMHRYDVLHNDGSVTFTNAKCGTHDFFRLTKSFDPKTLELIDCSSSDLDRLISEFKRVVDEVMAPKEG